MKMTSTNRHDEAGTTVIVIEYTDKDIDAIPDAAAFLNSIYRGWADLTGTVAKAHPVPEPVPDPATICAFPDCDNQLLPLDIEFADSFCESHQTDAWGVMAVDCYCYQSSADNADIDICGPHRRAWEARGEGPMPSSFLTR